ncbi:MAG: type II secretion system F family protein [Phycisphaerae bacterium]
MPTFEYDALTPGGRLMKGTIEAVSPQEADRLLRQMQLTVQEVRKASAPALRSAIGRNEFALFNQQLASMAKAGIPLERGLRELSEDVQSRRMKKLLEGLAGDLESGASIEEAFEKRREQFPPLYSQILKAGVKSGRLGEMLISMNRHLEIAGQTRRIVFEATAYPMVVLALAAGVLTFLFQVLVPQFRELYETFGVELPNITLAMLAMSEHVVAFWVTVGVLVVVIVGGGRLLAQSPGGRRFRELVFLRVPVVGRIYRYSLLARLADAMGLLVGAGVDLPTAMRMAAGATGSEVVIGECEMLAGEVERGRDVSGARDFCRIVPNLLLYSISLGSQRGQLPDNLYGLAEMYSQQARANQGRLQALLMPLMVILIGGLVGLAILGLFSPLVAMLRHIQGGGL